MRRFVLLAAVLLTASCSNGRPGLSNGSVSVCYRALPVAKSAVHDKTATLIGVHRVPVDRVRSELPPAMSAELNAENDRVVCVVSFKGDFTPGQVDRAPSTADGPYAVILVSSRHLHLVGSFVLSELPKAFGGRSI